MMDIFSADAQEWDDIPESKPGGEAEGFSPEWVTQ